MRKKFFPDDLRPFVKLGLKPIVKLDFPSCH